MTTERLLTLAAYASRHDSGNPLDQAILAVAPAGSDGAPRLATFPFTEDRGRETAIRGDTTGTLLAAVKGAPEVVLPMTTLNAAEQALWHTQVGQLAATGHKVIAGALELLIHPTALLVFQDHPASEHLPHLPPGRNLHFFTLREWLVLGTVGTLLTLAVVGGYAYSLGIGRDVAHARAMALVVLTVASATLTAGLSGLRHRTAWVMVLVTLGLSVLLVQTPLLATFMHLTPLHRDEWAMAMLGGVLVAILPALTWPSREKGLSS